MLTMEFEILNTLQFDLCQPTIINFIESYSSICDQNDKKVFNLACYLSELSLLEITMNKWKPSRIACSCLYLAKKLIGSPEPWPTELQELTNLTLSDVRESGPELLPIINNIGKH